MKEDKLVSPYIQRPHILTSVGMKEGLVTVRCPMVFLIILQLVAVYGFCPTFNTTQEGLRFTKDLNMIDFASVGQYKELPCCVNGYDSITWTRDDRPTENPFFFVSSDQQHVFFKYTRMSDAGNYSCTARNATNALVHKVQLKVFASSEYTGPPLPAAEPTDQWAEIGDKALFGCSVFLGFGTQRQLRNSQVYWVRSNDSFVFAERANHSTSWNENYTPKGEIIYSYLSIPKVDAQDFGQYICVANNGQGASLQLTAYLHQGMDPNTKVRNSYTVAVIMFGITAFITFALTVTYLSRRTQIHLLLKDRFAPLENRESSMQYDVFICYHSSDSSELVFSWLVPRLEQLYGYTSFVFERDMQGGDWMPDVFAAKIRGSRRFLLVLSRGLLSEGMCRLACQLAVQEALNPNRSFRLICVVPPNLQIQELMKETDPGGALRLILTVAKKITLPPKVGATQRDHAKFWRNLRLRLPPRRPEPVLRAQTYTSLDSTAL